MDREKRAAELTQEASGLRAKIDELLALDEMSKEQEAELTALSDQADGLDAEAKKLREQDRLATENRAKRDGYSQPQPRITREPIETPSLDGPAREAVLDDPRCGFAHLGEFASAVLAAGPNENFDVDTRLKIAAAAGTGYEAGTRSDGGAMLPPAFRTEIWDGVRTRSENLLGLCDVFPVDPGVDSITIAAVDETSRADGSRYGGVQGYWKSELTQMSESKGKMREVKFEPQELYVYWFVADKLLRRAPGTFASRLTSWAIDEIAFKVGDGIINGTGAGMPKGILSGTAETDSPRIEVSAETDQVSATIVSENVNKMWARMWAPARSGAIWHINQACETELEKLTMDVGTAGVPLYLPPGGIADAPLGRLKGRPVQPIEYCQALGTMGDIILWNPKFYGVALRGLVDQASSMHLKFDYAQTAFRLIYEIDGQPWVENALTPFKGTDTLSPLVALATRS